MSYFNRLGLIKEPFSTSPDPEFFYPSLSHYLCLKRLEINIRLKRGLSIVLGEVGVGKTTLSRALLKTFNSEEDFVFHLVLDPGLNSEYMFLSALARLFGIICASASIIDLKEAIEKYLFQRGVEENKTIILLIDEGQKLSVENLEVLRTLLNFETNEYKLLQLVILGQDELLKTIQPIKNFTDRAALMYSIGPLSEKETREMIDFRLEQANYRGLNSLFDEEATNLIYKHTHGYPRKIAMICHDALVEMVIKETPQVDKEIINGLIEVKEKYEKCYAA